MSSKLLRLLAEADRRRERDQKREERRRRRRRPPDPDVSTSTQGLEDLVEEDMILDVPYGGAGGEVRGCIPEAR